MSKLILRLTGSAKIRKVGKALRLHRLANWWLRHVPVVKTLPGGISYRARRIESLALSAEFFDHNVLYELDEKAPEIRAFADLGCNAGYFTCWLCDKLKNTNLNGIMVDANPEAVEDAAWHIEKNNLHGVRALFGLAGFPEKTGSADFFLHTSNVCSTAEPDPHSPAESWTRVKAPCLDIEAQWSRFFGDAPCDLLKVDIEGSEKEFMQKEKQFLKRVKTILMEWHKWKIDLEEVVGLLLPQGFVLSRVLHENEIIGTALFTRP